MSPTQLTLRECARRGWHAEVVERRVWRHVTRDFLGCIDIIAFSPTGMVGIQTTSGAHHADRLAKAAQQDRLGLWFARGRTFAVWSWAKQGARGKRKTWQLRAESVSRETFHEVAV